MRAIDFLYEEQRLDEVQMAPGKLARLASTLGATAGMEFEMIVPNVQGPDDGDMEPDYDQDERSSSWSNIQDFFMGGDGNNSRRDVETMIQSMQESFYEWMTDRQYDEWQDEGKDYLKDYMDLNNEFDEDDIIERAKEEIQELQPHIPEGSDEYNEFIENRSSEIREEVVDEEWNNEGRIYERAKEEFFDNHSGYDEGDWLWDNYPYMTDVYNEFGPQNDVYWPYLMSSGNGEDIENVAESFSDAIGRPCNASSDYHGIRREGEYTVEPDGSLDPDSSDDTGLEFVSPALPLDALIADLNDVVDWAKSYGCYTNESTGLHMNVSVPSFSNEKLDYVKLAILLGDEYVLRQFGRQANTYCRSGMQKVQSNIGQKDNSQVAEMLNQLKSGLAKEASDAIHSGYTDKYTSINTKKGYVEFRSPGGDWLNEDLGKLTATLNRFVVALDAACDPEKYKNEYYKKLYKLLSAGQEDTYGQMINDFAMYTTGVGGAPQKIVADFRRVALATLQHARGKETGQWWWNVAINGQRIEVVGDNPDDAWQSAITANREWARFDKRNAKIERLRPFVDNRPPSGTQVGATAGEPQQAGNQGNWGIWIQNASRFANQPGEYPAGQQVPLYRFSSQQAAEQWIEQQRASRPNMRTDIEVREIEPQQNTNQPTHYIVDANRNVIVNRYYANDPLNAVQYFERWKQQNDPQETGNYRYGRLSPETEERYRNLAATQPVRQTAGQPRGNWGIWVAGADRFAREPGEYPAGQEVPLRRFATQQDAELFLQRMRDDNPRMRSDVEVRQIEPQGGSQGGPYEAYNTRTGQVLTRLSATSDEGARQQLATYLANAPESMRNEIVVRRSTL